MSDLVKLDIMSDGSVSLCGTRITPNKMYGVQTVEKSIAVSEKAIIKALGVDKEIRAKAVEEFQKSEEPKCKYWNAEHEDCALNYEEIRNNAIDEFAERLKKHLDRRFSFGIENKFLLYNSIDEIAEEMRGAE